MILHERTGALIQGREAAQQSVQRELLFPLGSRPWDTTYGSTVLLLVDALDDVALNAAVEAEVARIVERYAGPPTALTIERDDGELIVRVQATAPFEVRIPVDEG